MARFLNRAIAARDFSALEIKLLMTIFDHTYAEKDLERSNDRETYQLERARISQRQFIEATGGTERNVRKYLGRLVDNRVVIRFSERTNKQAAEYGINTKIELWNVRKTGQIIESDYPKNSDSLTIFDRPCGEGPENLDRPQGVPLDRPRGEGLDPPRRVPLDRPQGVPLDRRNPASPLAPEAPIERIENIERIEGGESGHGSEPSLGQKIWRTIGTKYHPITGPPRAKLSNCLKYEEFTLENPELAQDCFNAAWLKLEEWEEQSGRQSRQPWNLLDQSIQFFNKGGPPKPDPKPEHPGYYNPDNDPDFMEDDDE